MKHPIVFLILAIATVPVDPLAAQTLRVVDPAFGPYKTIQAAVDAAAVGDLVEVRGGSSMSGATITKGLHLYGAQTFQVQSDVIVTGIPRGQQVVLSNFSFILKNATTRPASIVVTSCVGTVHVERVQGFGTGLSAKNSSHVTATDCGFTPVTGTTFVGPGIVVEDCSLSLRRCTAIGGTFTTVYRGPFGRIFWSVVSPFPGVTAKDARVVLVDCTLQGGPGGITYSQGMPNGYTNPAKGLDSVASTTTAVVKRSKVLTGSSPPVAEIAAAHVIRDPGVIAKVIGRETVQDLYDLGATGARPGGTVRITLLGKGVVSFAVFANHPSRPITGGPADIWLDLNAPVLLYADALNGRHDKGVATPASLPVGLTVCLQAVVLTSRGLESSTPSVIALR